MGANGMLGRAVTAAILQAGHKPIPLTHNECDISSRSSVQIALGLARTASGEGPIGAVINCAGVTDGESYSMALTNAAGPHVIDSVTRPLGIRLIHVSTDCVFIGGLVGTRIASREQPDNTDDLYGRTKIAGEVSGPGVVTVRTSFIGPGGGLLGWLLSLDRGSKVRGWRNAYWTGSTAPVVARKLVALAVVEGQRIGSDGLLVHLATKEKISKYDVLRLCDAVFDLGLKIEPVDEPRINRALVPDVTIDSLDVSLPELHEAWKHSDQGKAKV